MANPVVRIPPANPIRLIPQITLDSLYNTVPFDLKEDEDCYFQKWMIAEETSLQISILTTVTDTEINLYDATTNALVKTYSLIPATVQPDVSDGYTYYEIAVAFETVPAGLYYLELTCTDPDTTDALIYQSDIQTIQDEQIGTVVIEYRNSENDFSIIFDTGILFRLRVEATVEDYAPQFSDTSYIDETHNTTKLNSVYYDQFTFYSPNNGGFIVPWIAQKINIAMSCDSTQIDGVYYERIDGSKWDVQRTNRNKKMGIKIDIVPTDNLFQKRIKTGNPPPGNFQIVQKVLPYMNQANDLTIGGIFKKYSLLEKVVIENHNLTDFVILVGTSPGGSDLAIINAHDSITDDVDDVDSISHTITQIIDYDFYGSETVYLTGMTGVSGLSLDIFIIFKQLDAPPIVLPFTAPDQLGKGFTARYKEINPGDIVSAFDLGTGLGIAGSKWEKWAMADGRNGGIDESDCVAVMYNPSNTDYSTLDHTGGAATGSITLTTDQLPNFFLKMFSNYVNTAGGDFPSNTQRVARARAHSSQALDYEIERAPESDDSDMIGRTSSIGSGATIDIRQKYIVGLTIIKIQD